MSKLKHFHLLFLSALAITTLVSMKSLMHSVSYTNADKTKVGEPLSPDQESDVQAAINLIKCIEDSNSVTGGFAQDMLDAKDIEHETNKEADKGTRGNSAHTDKGSNSGGYPNPREEINLGTYSLDRSNLNKPGGKGKLASSIVHELEHIYSGFGYRNNECSARVAQANFLCQLACGAEGCMPTAEEKEEYCRLAERSRIQAQLPSNRSAEQTDDWLDEKMPACECCEASVLTVATPSADMIAAASHIPSGFNTGTDDFGPDGEPDYDPIFSFFATPNPYLTVFYYRQSDDILQFTTLPITLDIFPTAITGDDAGNIFIAGLTPNGTVQVNQYSFAFSGDDILNTSNSIIFTSPHLESISSMTYTVVNGESRIYALDGAGGRFGYYSFLSGQVTNLANKATDPHMTGWKSFEMAIDEASGNMAAQLCMRHANEDYTRGDDELYILVDNDDDGTLDSRTLAYARDVVN
jgi:hypothetical protein